MLVSISMTAATAQQPIAVPALGYQYTQDFDVLDTLGTNLSMLPTGWAIAESGNGNAADGLYRAGHGTSNNGDTYSFGAPGSQERALGSVASGSVLPSYGVMFTNNTLTDTITSVVIKLRLEQWRVGHTVVKADTVSFHYSMDADSIGDIAPTASWIEVPSLMLNSVDSSASQNSGDALNGNDSQYFRMITDSFSVIVPPGSNLLLKWTDRNISSSDDGLAIDDVSITFNGSSMLNGVATMPKEMMPLTIYYNPEDVNLTFGFHSSKAEIYTVEVLDLTGRVIYNGLLRTTIGTQRHSISNPGFRQGVYLLKVSSSAAFGITKFFW